MTFKAKPKYVKQKEPPNTSGGTNMTRRKKRDIIMSIAYAFGTLSNDNGESIIINTQDKETKQYLVDILNQIDWVSIKDEKDTSFVLKAGVIYRPLKHLIRRISFGREKVKTIKNSLKFLQTDTLIKMLWKAHGRNVNGHRLIDMTSYFDYDVKEIIIWSKIINDIDLEPITDEGLLMPGMVRDESRKIYILVNKKGLE